MQPRQTGRIPPIRLDPVARPLRDQRRRHHNAVVPVPRQVTLDAIAARARLVAEPKPDALAAELAHQTIQGPSRVGDPAICPDLAADAALGDRHDNPLLVNIKPDIRDTIPTTRLLCMRFGTGQSGATLLPAYCETGRPVLRRTCGLALHPSPSGRRKIIETIQLLHDFIGQGPTAELAARTFTWRSRCTSKMRSCSFGSSELTYARCQGRTSRLPITDSLDATTPI